MPFISFNSTAASVPGEEQELKFHVPFPAQVRLSQWIRTAFRPHPAFHRSMICSVYFDTLGLRHLDEKRASDFTKTKHRIRWYSDSRGQPLTGPAWLETKHKRGNTRVKTRTPLPVSGAEIARVPLWDPRWLRWAGGFSPANFPRSAGALQPMVEVRYQRERFYHPLFAATFCLDTEIHCPRVHPGGGFVHSTARLTEGVFEQKSLSFEVLPPARALPRFNVRRSSFSKYERLALTLLDDPELTTP